MSGRRVLLFLFLRNVSRHVSKRVPSFVSTIFLCLSVCCCRPRLCPYACAVMSRSSLVCMQSLFVPFFCRECASRLSCYPFVQVNLNLGYTCTGLRIAQSLEVTSKRT